MNILILTSATGSGHNMRARAFQAWMQQCHGDRATVKIHEVLEETHFVYHFGVRFYNWIQRHAPWLHHLYFNYLEVASMHRHPDRIMGGAKFTRVVRDFEPALIVSVHAHTNHGFFELARRALPDKKPRCITYCGELFGGYGLSRHWVNPKADLFIGAVPDVCEAAQSLGMPAAKTHCGGFLLRPAFYGKSLTPDERKSILGRTGADPDLPCFLFSTGDVGANNHLRFLQALEAAALPVQVVAICGNNRKTMDQLVQWSQQAVHVRVFPLGYIDYMHSLMQSVSAIVARPGTGTTSEAILLGCPLIHNGVGGIMPQEWITVKFCQKNKLSRVTGSPRHLAEIIREWLQNPEELHAIRQHMQQVLPTNNPQEMMDLILSFPSTPQP